MIRPGVREAVATVQNMAAQIMGARSGPAATGLRPLLMSSSPHTGTRHILWSEVVFRNGMQVNMEVSGNRYNYDAAIMRTFSIGAPSDQLR